MTPHTYVPGDKVKIISMEEVRKYPIYVRNKEYKIGNEVWIPPMDHLAGTIQKIKFVGSGFYDMEDVGYTFSPEMIAGPAEAPQVPDREKYAERLKEFVQIVMAANRTGFNSASAVIESAKNLLAAFDEEVKKYK